MTRLADVARRIRSIATNETNALCIARWLLEHVTQKSFYDHLTPLTEQESEQLDRLIHEIIVEQKPLNYALGTVPFLGLMLQIEPPILIPRPETEHWCADVIERIKKSGSKNLAVLDLCTGSGCIALALAHHLPQATIDAVDCSPQAIDLAERNRARTGLSNVTIYQSDLYAALLTKKYDLIVANPPYLANKEWDSLDESIRSWEDPGALLSGSTGLEIIERIIQGARSHVIPRKLPNLFPNLWIEIGHSQAEAVAELMRIHGFSDPTVHRDLAGLPRIISATMVCCSQDRCDMHNRSPCRARRSSPNRKVWTERRLGVFPKGKYRRVLRTAAQPTDRL